MEKVSTIYINNLPPDTTQEELTEKFNEFGAVKAVRLLRANNGECRGYAFLDYDTEAEAVRAINEGNDSKFHGCKIKVERSRHQLGDPPRPKRHLRDRPSPGGGITGSSSASYIRRRDDSPLMQSSPPRGRNIIYGQSYTDNSPPRPQQYRSEAFIHKVPINGYSGIGQYPPPYRYRDDSPPPRYRGERDYPYEPRRYLDRDYELERDYSYRDRERRNPRERIIYRDSSPQQPSAIRRIRDDYYETQLQPQRRSANYRERIEDSPPVKRRIIKEDSPVPPPRRIYDDDSPLPRRRIIEDDDSPLPPPPRRIIDDDSPPPRNDSP